MPITVTDKRVIDPDTGEVRPGTHPAAEPDAADARVAELTADLQRERAQFANFKRRAAEEKQGSVAYGKQILIDKLLPVLDDLDRAREHGDLESGPLRAVADKLVGALSAEGLARFGEPGDEFNPELHEAVQHDGDGAHPVLGAVYRCGYRLGDKVIRTAMVTVTDPAETAAP
ncbi:nucleotide exchange factor GrpE [Gordonia sp. ABSL49_1]|nr:nucleotide exchange factor GrpE [Gordonia sp. ABSL49_1]